MIIQKGQEGHTKTSSLTEIEFSNIEFDFENLNKFSHIFDSKFVSFYKFIKFSTTKKINLEIKMEVDKISREGMKDEYEAEVVGKLVDPIIDASFRIKPEFSTEDSSDVSEGLSISFGLHHEMNRKIMSFLCKNNSYRFGLKMNQEFFIEHKLQDGDNIHIIGSLTVSVPHCASPTGLAHEEMNSEEEEALEMGYLEEEGEEE